MFEYMIFSRNYYKELQEFTNNQVYDLTIERCPNGAASCYINVTNLLYGEVPLKIKEGDVVMRSESGNYNIITAEDWDDLKRIAKDLLHRYGIV